MSWTLLLTLTAITIASRVLPMTLLPTPRGRTAAVLDALPAPLFASLAALSFIDGGAAPAPEVIAAAAGALVGASRKSLGLTLACGVAAFVVTRALLA